MSIMRAIFSGKKNFFLFFKNSNVFILGFPEHLAVREKTVIFLNYNKKNSVSTVFRDNFSEFLYFSALPYPQLT